MESIIKISSEQGFSETWVPADVATSPPTQKLLDFIIPANTGTYDLGKCWINVNAEVVPSANANETSITGLQPNSTALYNNDIVAETDAAGSNKVCCDFASIVRNADMFSANRGMVESISRVNTLRQLLFNIENDKAEQHDGNLNLGTFFGRRGPSNGTSHLLQIMGSNTSVGGTVDESITASNTRRDLRIPLSDLFGVGSALWNSDVYGSTRIHLELDTSRLRIEQLGGSEDTTNFQPAGQNRTYGAMLDNTAASAALGGPPQLPDGNDLGVDTPLVTAISYDDFELQMPFYVGQAVEVAFTNTAGAQTAYAQISGVEYNQGTNLTNPPNGTRKVRLYTAGSIYNNGTGAAENITGITVKALRSTAATDQIRINNAEIVLTQLPSVNGPDSIDYRTYSTEETQGIAGLTSFNKQIMVEPNAQNLLVAHCNSNETLPSREWTSYRMSIDNVDVSGNRDIVYNKPLHRDRIARTFNNRGQNISNFSLNAVKIGAQQAGDANQLALYPIYETLPLTQAQKIINFKLNAPAIQDVVFFKELQKTI